jgi:pyridoxamine 5'-phosphate oxidase-like protein
MASWSEVEQAAPELAARARRYFDAHKHKTLATLRKDGSPRISGTEVEFTHGEMWIGSMWRAVKALDLRRDPRYAIHSGSGDTADWSGDAKVAGRIEEVEDPEVKQAVSSGETPPGPFHLFRCDVAELVVVRLGEPADHLVIESWHEGRGLSRVKR